ncbi:MAG: MMPL family transporter [Desulfobulbaceae bacterium]|nr:MMPL family transporter [Desulfobulbaceae bacterium]
MKFYLPGNYFKLVLGRPLSVLFFLVLVCSFFAYHAENFKLDASADSLVLEGDEALKYYRSIRARYGTDDFLILTYTPNGDLFNNSTLGDLQNLRDDILSLPAVVSVVSILDVPLLESPPVSLEELQDGIRTLADPSTQTEQARQELISSPLYRNRLVSPDGSTTALQIKLRHDKTYYSLLKKRDRLREKRLHGKLTPEESAELKKVIVRFQEHKAAGKDTLLKSIAEIRGRMAKYQNRARLHLGGVPMIVADSIGFIRHDLFTFGTGVLFFLVLILMVAFGRLRWVLLPMLTCFATGLIMIGFLGLVDWPVTVVSANFLSLLLIISLSLSVHLIVSYREQQALHPDGEQVSLVKATMQHKFLPCFYTALTTVIAFSSLLISGIRPLIDFGWMMSIGITVAFIMAFTLFPAALMMFRSGRPSESRNITAAVTSYIADCIEKYPGLILVFFAILVILSAVGMMRLTVENRFIDYYKKSTEIYQGMELIDRKLGGTTPLDVIVDAPENFFQSSAAEEKEEDPFADELGMHEPGITTTSYWFNSYMLEKAETIHSFLDGLPESGKVLSISTFMQVVRKIDEQSSLDTFFLAILYKKLPEKIKEKLIYPYMSRDGNQLRFNVRVYESDYSLRRQAMLDTIRSHLTDELGLADEQVHFTGMVVLYNNMLQSLFRSQILTIGFVFVAILLMFAILFRNLKLAAVAILPNLVAAAVVLGIMGWLNIPLDMMTVSIAAICIGIAVDDTIHYVFRIRIEYRKDNDYRAAVRRCHGSIGHALYYTTVCIALGFSILALSNFVPTIYFGLLTGFSMTVALMADLTLLPLLIIRFRALD